MNIRDEDRLSTADLEDGSSQNGRNRAELSAERNALALSAFPALVYEWDVGTRAWHCESGLEELTGWRASEVPADIGWWKNQVHADDRAELSDDHASLHDGSTKRILCYRLRHRDQRWIWVEDRGVLQRQAAGARVVGLITDVTARHETQQALQQSRDRFAAAASAVSSVVWTNNARGEMQGPQPGWAAFTGQTYEQYQQYGWSAAVHPSDAQPTIDAWNEAVAERKNFVFEHRVRRHDGAWRLFAVHAVPVIDANGLIREWVGVHTDITDQRAATEELQRSELRFRQLAESMPQIVWTADASLQCDYINGRWTELTGCDLEATRAGEFRAGMPPDDVKRATEVARESLALGSAFSVECRFRRIADGELRWHLVRGVPVLNADGTIRNWLGTATDIDDQRRAAESVRESEERFRLLANNISQFAWMADATGWIHWYNQRWFNYTGTTPGEMQGWGWQRVHHPDHVARVTERFRTYVERGEAWEDTFPIRGQDGAYRWFLSPRAAGTRWRRPRGGLVRYQHRHYPAISDRE